jgi:hypothetical protein
MEIKSRPTPKARRSSIITLTIMFCLGAPLMAQQVVPAMPMQARYEDGAEFRWLNKKVLNSRPLDSMEELATWSFSGAGRWR